MSKFVIKFDYSYWTANKTSESKLNIYRSRNKSRKNIKISFWILDYVVSKLYDLKNL